MTLNLKNRFLLIIILPLLSFARLSASCLEGLRKVSVVNQKYFEDLLEEKTPFFIEEESGKNFLLLEYEAPLQTLDMESRKDYLAQHELFLPFVINLGNRVYYEINLEEEMKNAEVLSSKFRE